MSKFVVAINVPGYLPTDDEPPTFDTAWEAWEFLADQPGNEFDDCNDDSDMWATECCGADYDCIC